MTWMRISLDGPGRHKTFESLRAAFVQVWLDQSDDDRAAVYVTKSIEGYPPDIITAYFSPIAAEMVVGHLNVRLEPCERPEAIEVALSVGNFIAADPLWTELPDFYRSRLRADLEREFDDPERIEVMTEHKFRAA